MDLLTNAIESIQVGVEDWEEGSRPRLLSAIRNIHAGILLLYKEKLRRKSPPESNESLLKAKLRPSLAADGGVVFVGDGRKTVDIPQIRDRFKSIGIETNWNQFDGITAIRNDIEHYYADVSKDSLRGVIASAFLIIRTFLIEELNDDPRKLLGQKTWDAMLRATEVYAAERADCVARLSAFDWQSPSLEKGVQYLRCEACLSDLLVPKGESIADVSLSCRSCGAPWTAEDFIPTALAVALDWEMYLAAKGEMEEPLTDCPHCGLASYVLEEDRCAVCGESATRDCAVCGTAIPASELGSSPLCGHCEYLLSKDD